MSKLYLDVRTPDLHPPTVHPLPDAAAPLGLVDRVSLRLGLWLLLRSARNARRHADHGQHARRVHADRGRLAREAAALRLLALAPRR
ncbi:hypothetical protein QL996_01280 [Planococcus sp. APC 4015]|nr:hypothetical protein [Planococcus sp. APC 4015]